MDKPTTISDMLQLSPLTLFTLTLSVERGEPIEMLVQRLHANIQDLQGSGALKGL
ncbi:hypothetical protein [Pseudomonas helleri]|uniref:hypothetical protein n=1 Tax=Pseudomonas helleri TaxID=1608996 RepID=UPI0033426C0E